MGEMLMETEFNTLWSIKACYFICTITLVQISTNFSNSFTATVSNELQKSSSKIPPRLKSVANYLAKIDFNSVTLKRVIQCTCAAKSFISSILTQRGIAKASVVCPSVSPSITLRYHGRISWIFLENNFTADKPILFILGRFQHDISTPKGTAPNFSRNRSGVGKIVDFRHLSRRISGTVQDRAHVAIDH